MCPPGVLLLSSVRGVVVWPRWLSLLTTSDSFGLRYTLCLSVRYNPDSCCLYLAAADPLHC